MGQFTREGKTSIIHDQAGGDAIFIHVKIDLVEGRFGIVFMRLNNSQW